MTREEQIDWLCRLRTDLNNGVIFTPWNKEFTEALNDVLEQEPTTKSGSEDEYVSRSKLMCVLSDYYDTTIEYRSMLKEIAALPAVTPQEPRWIPVSEKLPEKDGCYLVTEKSGRVCTYVFHKEGNSEEYWTRCTTAWMPLPLPWKGE